MTFEHDFTCHKCGARAEVEQCGGLLSCKEHVLPVGRAVAIDESTARLYGGATVKERLRDILSSSFAGINIIDVSIGSDSLLLCYSHKRAIPVPATFEGRKVHLLRKVK